jgi:hypothetical protein
MAFYTIGFLGTAPIGGPVVGWIAQQYGTSAGLLVGTLGCTVAGGMAFLGRREGFAPTSREHL